MSIAIAGCTVVDAILPDVGRLPHWPRHREFTPRNLVLLESPPVITLGGNGANAAYAAASQGADVVLHTSIGSDPLGQLAQRWLEQAGCGVRSPRVARTALNVTATNAAQQRATFFYPGAPYPLPAALDHDASLVLVCGWPHPPCATLARRLRAWRALGLVTALDLGPWLTKPWTMREVRSVLRTLDLLFGNEFEIRRLTGKATLAGAVRELRSAFGGDLIVKRGAEGVALVARGTVRIQFFAAPRVRAENTIGAGDVFNGTVLALYSRGHTLAKAVARGVKTASRMVASKRGVIGLRVPERPGELFSFP